MRRIAVFLIGVLVVVGAAACGGDDGASDIPAGVSSAVEAFTEAINTYDTEALLAVTTEGFTWESTGPVQSRAEFVDHFEANYEAQNFSLEVTGELMVEADGDGYVAEEPGRVTSNAYNEDGRSTYRLVELGGSWLVEEFRWYEDGVDE